MAENGTTLPTNSSTEETGFAQGKGKGKAAAEGVPHTEDAAMDEEDEEDDDDDDEEEEEVCTQSCKLASLILLSQLTRIPRTARAVSAVAGGSDTGPTQLC